MLLTLSTTDETAQDKASGTILPAAPPLSASSPSIVATGDPAANT
eukprot:CAMPEP_0115350744 /NCGR_PEP_ID=MMETSP0270-20121206/96625_1 /TAXON_ID=71861 /ORGANISM="Scrippsiella trochoidea, Strain CCMP3099" /LENGTH=44 /DNA_ID= /DNA_START= /DNA_END= /DNA_ORIENTATION=